MGQIVPNLVKPQESRWRKLGGVSKEGNVPPTSSFHLIETSPCYGSERIL